MATSIYKVDTLIQNEIIEAYKSNISLREIENKFNVSRNTISKFLEEKGIKTTKGNHYRKYFHNEDFFEIIDTEEKAYWLGMMYSDGYIVNNENRYGQDSFGLTLAEDSIDTIEKFKSSLQATNPIRYDNSKQGQRQAKLVCTSQKTVNDLIKHGVFKGKSLLLQPPMDVPNNLLNHFIRGFFDGDGCISYSKISRANYLAFNINFTSTYEMIVWLYNIFKIGSIYPEKRRENTWYYSIGGNQQVLQICHYMYDNATIWMNRKYECYQLLLNKYGENRGINV